MLVRKDQIKIRVSHMGSRGSYLVPRMIHEQQMLELFCTDLWCGYAAILRKITQFKTIEKACNFFHGELPPKKVHAFNLLGLRIRLACHRAKKYSNYSLYKEFIHYGRTFCQHVNKLPPQDHNVFLGYTCGALETLELERKSGNFTILDQIHAGKMEDVLVEEERGAWPGWDCREDPKPEEYHQRLEAEWHTAHLVVVNSVFSKNALVAQGIKAEKIALIPEAFMVEQCGSIRNKWTEKDSLLNVIFLSNVTLLKGIQYLIQTARLMAKEPVKFVIVGSINMNDKIIRDAPPNMQFIGKVNPNRVNEWLDQSQVFVFPTISDGFGRVQLEAMARGLPVIATPNCGEVVTDGVDGFIVPIRDPEALREKIQKILDQPDLLPFLSQNALKKVASFSLKAIGELWQKKIESAFLKMP